MLQRTEEWYEQRRGRFTASDIHRILGKEGLKATVKSIENIALEKAIEQVYGLDQEVFLVSFDMQRGIELEPLAFQKFKSLKELDFVETKECGFFKYEDHAGASPDGVVSDSSVLEIKCPKRNNFFNVKSKNLIDPKYFAQMQMQMLCTGFDKCYYFTYTVIDAKELYHEIIIERDDKFISFIKERIEHAIELKKEFIKKI